MGALVSTPSLEAKYITLERRTVQTAPEFNRARSKGPWENHKTILCYILLYVYSRYYAIPYYRMLDCTIMLYHRKKLHQSPRLIVAARQQAMLLELEALMFAIVGSSVVCLEKDLGRRGSVVSSSLPRRVQVPKYIVYSPNRCYNS